MRASIIVVALVGTTGCARHIGDSCKVNADCSPLGDRFCDVASPEGYCTIEGCDVSLVDGKPRSSCPDDAICVRFFEQVASHPCDPLTATTDCAPTERCLCDCSDPDRPGFCLEPIQVVDGHGSTSLRCPPAEGTPAPAVGHCAPESSERRTCQKKCERDSDCRQGYECRQTGTRGAESVPTMRISVETDGGAISLPVGTTAKFCVQAAG